MMPGVILCEGNCRFGHYYFYLAGNQLSDWCTHRRGWSWWSCKKSIANFTYNQWVYSLDMKTKVARHVPRINISMWYMIYDFNMTYGIWQHDKQSLLSLDMKTKVVKHMKTKLVVTVTVTVTNNRHCHRHNWFPALVENIWNFVDTTSYFDFQTPKHHDSQ